MKYSKHFSTKTTPQSQPIPGSTQVPNNAGGFAWAIDDWKRLDRFLVLGSEGGTYYVSEQTLTIRNAEAVLRCIKADGLRVVNRVVEISESGRAPKNDPALFVFNLCTAPEIADVETRKAAYAIYPRIARIGTWHFTVNEMRKAFGGWGRGWREMNAAWYNDKDADQLAYQVVKYRQRGGWTHRDVLRLAHPVPPTKAHKHLYGWITQDETKKQLPDLVTHFIEAQACTDRKAITRMIRDYNLTREMIPTQFLADKDVWAALLENMPMTAMIRNLGNMSKVGLLVSGNWDTVNLVADRITDKERLRKARVHPLSILAALNTYSQGGGFRGKGEWDVVGKVVDALDTAFYLSFGNVEPINQRISLALDVSGSMTCGNIAGVGGITPRVGAAAMALVTANVEPNHYFVGFSDRLIKLKISPRQRIDDVCRYMNGIPFGGTDCSLPIYEALDRKVEIDLFILYTDSETWAGLRGHPAQALQEYRRKVNPNARSVVVGMVSNGFSIADPDDAGMLDVVGFDTATPNVIGQFARGF